MTSAPKLHSKLGASNCKRWWMCPGSVAACKDLPNQSTVYANEGSAAHALGEHCLRKNEDPELYLDNWVDVNGVITMGEEGVPEKERGVTTFYIDEQMVEAVQTYVEFARSIIEEGDEYEIEQRIDLSSRHPALFGTADLVVYKPKSKKLVVVDYKHGRGVPVEVTENVQGLYYAAGAAIRHHNRGIAEVEIVIVQPRCAHKDGSIRRWSTSPLDLTEWVDDLVAAAKATEDKNAPRNAGDWCKFCPAAATCDAYKAAALEAANADFAVSGDVVLTPPASYSPAALATTLKNIDLIESWCRAVKKFAHDEAIAGNVPPGWKLVYTRATRKWKGTDIAIEKLDLLGYDESFYMAEPKLLTPAQAEKKIGKKVFAEIEATLIEKKPSGVVLAPVEDKREAVRPDAAQEFA